MEGIDPAIGLSEESSGWERLILGNLASLLCRKPRSSPEPDVHEPGEECNPIYRAQKPGVHPKQGKAAAVADGGLHSVSAHHGPIRGMALAVELDREEGSGVAAGDHKI